MKTLITTALLLTSLSTFAQSSGTGPGNTSYENAFSNNPVEIVGERKCSVTIDRPVTDQFESKYDRREIELTTTPNGKKIDFLLVITNYLNGKDTGVIEFEGSLVPKFVKGAITLDHYSGELEYNKKGDNEFVRIGDKNSTAIYILRSVKNNLVFFNSGNNTQSAYFNCK